MKRSAIAILAIVLLVGAYSYAASSDCRSRSRSGILLCMANAVTPYQPPPTPTPDGGAGPSFLNAEMLVMPDGGEGVPALVEYCDAIPATTKAGNWYCIQADGGPSPGSALSWATTGIGNSQNVMLYSCSVGQACGPLLHGEFIDGGGVVSSPYNAQVPFTSCGIWNSELHVPENKIRLAGNLDGYFTHAGWAWYADVGGGVYKFGVWDNALNFSLAGNIPLLRGSSTSMCGIYPNDGGQVTTYKGRVLGEQGSGAGANVGTSGQPAGHVWLGSGFDNTNPSTAIRSRGTFYTERVLDAGEIADLNDIATGITLKTANLQDSFFHRRASSLGCAVDNSFASSSASVSTGNTGCRGGGKLYIGRAAYMLLTYSNSMLNSTFWPDVGTPARTRATTLDHFGTVQMVELHDDDAAAQEGIKFTSYTIGASGTYAFSCWARSYDGGTLTMRMVGASNSVGDSTCTYPLTTTSTRYGCVSDAGYTADPVTIDTSVLVGAAAADLGSLQVQDCQLEQNYKVGGYTQTYGSQRDRNNDLVNMTRLFDAGIRSASGFIAVPTVWDGRHNITEAIYPDDARYFAAWFSNDGGNLQCEWNNPTVTVTVIGATPFTKGTDQRWGCFWNDAGVPTACVDSSCTSGAAVTGHITKSGPATVTLGGAQSIPAELDSWIWNVCMDKSPLGCDYR